MEWSFPVGQGEKREIQKLFERVELLESNANLEPPSFEFRGELRTPGGFFLAKTISSELAVAQSIANLLNLEPLSRIRELVVGKLVTSPRLVLSVKDRESGITYKGILMAFVLSAVQEVDVVVSGAVDARGNPAAFQGVPEWQVSDENVLSVTPSPDGMSAVVKAVGLVSSAQVSVSVDADLGEGVKPLVATLDVEVVAGEAVSLNISTGTPRDQQP